MIQRAFIHIAGPTGSGKTAFVEALLAADDGPTLVARCVRDDSLRRSRESSPRTHPEMQRYRQAGAYATATFAFPRHDPDPIEFYETQLMLNYSRAVILEGDNPAGYADLEVFVAPAPLAERRCTCGGTRMSRRRNGEGRREGGAPTPTRWYVHVDAGGHGPTGRRLCPQESASGGGRPLQDAGRHRASSQWTTAQVY